MGYYAHLRNIVNPVHFLVKHVDRHILNPTLWVFIETSLNLYNDETFIEMPEQCFKHTYKLWFPPWMCGLHLHKIKYTAYVDQHVFMQVKPIDHFHISNLIIKLYVSTLYRSYFPLRRQKGSLPYKIQWTKYIFFP